MSTWQTAGKVRMTPKGTYSGSTAYEVLDIVSNSDGTVSYIAKQAVPAGTALTNTTYWAVIASVEDAIDAAEQALSNIAEEYSPGTYSVGDYVTHDGYLYRCISEISSSESWTAAHWTQVVMTDEMELFLDEVNDIILVQSTQPDEDINKIWIPSTTPEGTQVPTYAEFQAEEAMIAAEFSTSNFYAIGDYCTYNNVLYRFTSAHASGVAWSSGDVTEIKVCSEVKDLKTQINAVPDIRESSATGVDLDLTDGSGNVIARFKDGHIQTKEFSSESLATALNGKQDVLTFDDTPTESSNNPVKSGGIYSAIAQVENILGENTAPVILSKSVGFNTVPGEYCDPLTGIIYDSSAYSTFVRSDYLPVSYGDVLRVTWCRHYIFFDSSKTYVSGGDISSLAGYTGTQEENFITIPSGVAYLMVNFYPAYDTYAVTMEGKGDPEIVILGDSIYGIGPYPFNPCYYAAADLRLNVADCAFGGTTAASRTGNYGLYTLENIADCIAAGDFSTLEDFTGMPAIFKQHRTTLANIDWTKVKIICIAHCTNDWDFGYVLDNDQNSKDKSTFLGALRYSMETIWAEYPQIQFLLFGALYKTVTNDTGHDTDSAVNINGKTLQEFIAGMKSVAEEYHQNFFNHYNIGFNSINASVVFRTDGVHLSYDVGAPMLGVRTAKEIDMVLWEV